MWAGHRGKVPSRSTATTQNTVASLRSYITDRDGCRSGMVHTLSISSPVLPSAGFHGVCLIVPCDLECRLFPYR